MSHFLTVFGLTLLPALGNFSGGLLAEFWHPSKRNLNRAMHAVLAAVLAYLLLRNQSEPLKMVALVFTAGLLLVAAVEDMITEAHESMQDAPGSILVMIGGFVLFTFVSAGLG